MYRKYEARGWLPLAAALVLAVGVRATADDIVANADNIVANADDGEDQYAVAAGHYAQQRWDLAVREFDVLLRDFPQHRRARRSRFYLGEALVQLGRFEEAQQHFAEYVRRSPQDRYVTSARFRAAEAAYLSGKLAVAKDQLGLFLATYPKDRRNAYVLAYLGDVALRTGHAQRAEKTFRQGLVQFGDGPMQHHYRIGTARALVQQDKAEEAKKIYRAVAAQTEQPLAGKAQFLLGTLHYNKTEFDQAAAVLKAFDTTFARSTYRRRAMLNRAWALLEIGRGVEAAKLFSALADDTQLGVAARYGGGLTRKRSGDFRGAAKTLAQTADAHPKHALAPALRFHAGDAWRRAGDHAAAIKQFDRVLANARNSPWADDCLLGKAYSALASGDHAGVAAHVSALGTEFPASDLSIRSKEVLAQSLLDRRQFDKAALVLEPIVDAAVRHERRWHVRLLLARAKLGGGQSRDGLKLLESVSAAAKGSLRASALLARAEALRNAGRYQDAIGPLRAYLKENADAAAAHRARAALVICYARSRQLFEAGEVYQQLRQSKANSEILLPATLHFGEAAFAAGNHALALKLFDRLTAKGNPPRYIAKGISGKAWCQHRAKDLKGSAETFEQLLLEHADSPLAPEAALVRGRMLEKLDRATGALAMYYRVIDDYKTSDRVAEALLAAARLHDRLYQRKEAAALYARLAKAHSQGPQAAAVLYEWSWVLRDLKKQDEADALLARLRKEHPGSRFWAEATYQLADRAAQAKNSQQAEKLLEELIAAKPKAALVESALYLRGQLAVEGADWQRAKAAFGVLNEEFPAGKYRLSADYWIAEVVYRQGQYQEAGRLFERLSQQARGRKDAWLAMIPLRRAQVFAQQAKWTDAKMIVEQVARDFPKFNRLYEVDYLLGRCLANEADFAKAREKYRRVIRSPAGKNTETAAMAQWMIGETFLHQEQYETAVAEYLKVDIRYGFPRWQAGSLLQAGKCYELLGRWDEATKLYERAIEKYPKTEFSAEVDRRLRVVRQRSADKATESIR
ncbi:MAG: tetratricopeptide repeat protein [Planctomycetes bacterium]|nr:tetratricopeptide repeat protein [Planctomycetota bacterium]